MYRTKPIYIPGMYGVSAYDPSTYTTLHIKNDQSETEGTSCSCIRWSVLAIRYRHKSCAPGAQLPIYFAGNKIQTKQLGNRAPAGVVEQQGAGRRSWAIRRQGYAPRATLTTSYALRLLCAMHYASKHMQHANSAATFRAGSQEIPIIDGRPFPNASSVPSPAFWSRHSHKLCEKHNPVAVVGKKGAGQVWWATSRRGGSKHIQHAISAAIFHAEVHKNFQ